MKGKLITFEGSEGSGKSTQASLLYKYLVEKKKRVMFVREPGGVRISEAIRRLLLDPQNKGMNDVCETLLYMAARSQLVGEVMIPALKRGTIILCDRFLDSTVVYQGFGNKVNRDFINYVGKIVTQGVSPAITFLFDITTQKGFGRKSGAKDRIEQRSLQYHNRVRQGYLELARREPHRIRIIKADRPREEIQGEIRKYVDRLIGLS